MEGIYATYFTGATGSGHALLVLRNGVIVGSDVTGGVLDGTYSVRADGGVDVSVTLTVPAGASLVTGAVAGQNPMSQTISASLPTNFSDGNPVAVDTPTGPVNVIFRRLRDVP